MKVLGIVAAKENSTRFKDKNIHQVSGLPMFMHAVNALEGVANDVVVCTNSKYIINYCTEKADFNTIREIIYRGINISKDSDPIYKVIKYAYQYINISYDYIIFILANSIHHTSKDVQNALDLAVNHNLKEVRSYDKNGVENGIVVLHKSVLENYDYISTYMGAVITNGKEIHYKYEL